ncbi:MAG: hypothetical protein ACP5SJ_00395 [Candidatus Micrarchaeia archaeon]
MTSGLDKGKKPNAKAMLLLLLALSVILTYFSLYLIQNTAEAASLKVLITGGTTTPLPPYSEVFYANTIVTTPYTSVLSGKIFQQAGSTGFMPFASQILRYNNNNAQWLITCPISPNPLNTSEYFQSLPYSYIAGDACINNMTFLYTPISLLDFFSWSPESVASTIATVSIDKIGNAYLHNFVYSVSTQSPTGTLNVSNGYNTKSYVFDNVPSSTQGGVWSWITQFADLSNTKLSNLQQQQTIGGLYINQEETFSNTVNGVTTTWNWVCTYPYTYSFNSMVENVVNANIPIPLYYALHPYDFLVYNGMEVPVNTIKTIAPPFIATFSGCGFKTLQNMYNGCNQNTGGWDLTSYVGKVLYINGTDLNSQSCDGYSGYTGHIYENTTNPQELGTVYGSVCPFGSVGWHNFSLATFNTTFMGVNVTPYFLYNFTMPSVISNANGNPDYINMSYDLYSPHNYLNPESSLDPFTLDTGSAFLANDNGTLTLFPYNAVSISNPNPSSLSHGVSYFLSAFNKHIKVVGIPSNISIYWFRIRYTPPNFVMPTVTFGTVSPLTEGQTNPVSPIETGWYVPITLKNTQPIGTPAGFQQMIVVDSAAYTQYEAANLTNVEFFNSTGYVLDSWIESGNSNKSTQTVYWVKLRQPIHSESENTIYMGFGYSYNTQSFPNFMNGNTVGQASNLYPMNPSYDNGKYVFNVYESFAGSLPQNWAPAAFGGTYAPIKVTSFPYETNFTLLEKSYPQLGGYKQNQNTQFSPLNNYTFDVYGNFSVGYGNNDTFNIGGDNCLPLATSVQQIKNDCPFGLVVLNGTGEDSLSFLRLTNHNKVISTGIYPKEGAAIYSEMTEQNLNSELLFYNASVNYFSVATANTPISSGSSFLSNTNPELELQNMGMNTIVVNPPALPPSFKLPIGSYFAGKIYNSTFIALSPNNYVYVINYTTNAGLGSGSAASYLYTMRFIPLGYFNLTDDQPAIQVSQSFSSPPTAQDYNSLYQQWWGDWEGYWSNAIMQQSSNIYVTNVNELSKYSYSCFLWSCGHGSFGSSLLRGFRPTGIATDYAGDVFAIGRNNAGTKDVLAALYTNSTIVMSTINPGFVSSSEIAVTPNGKYIYIANASDQGYIAIYQAPSLAEVGEIDLSYSNDTYALNISSYFAQGGPFNNTESFLGYFKKFQYENSNDLEEYHHPLGLAEYDGILYVLDNWTNAGNVGSSSTSSGSYTLGPFAMLMLRAFNGNGTEIPVDAFKHYDLISANSIIASDTEISALHSFPPYGWPLSVAIAKPPGIGGQTRHFCSIDSINGGSLICINPEQTATNTNGYLPIGPYIDSAGSLGTGIYPNDTGFSSDFNGDIYLLFHGNVSASGMSGATNYVELISLKMNIENYTKQSNGAYSPYLCYLNNSSIGSGYCASLKGNPANTLSVLYPPLIGIPNSFKFSEGNGPIYFGYQNLIATSFPTGVGGSSSGSDPPYEPFVDISINPNYHGDTDNIIVTANSEVPDDPLKLTISNKTSSIQTTGTGNIIYDVSSLPVGTYNVIGCDISQSSCAPAQTLAVVSQPLSPSSVTSPPPIYIKPVASYLKSIINGYVLVPYNITYSLVQNYTPNPDNGYVSGGFPPIIGQNGFTGPDCPPYSFTNTTNYYVDYATLPVSISSPWLNATMQSGGTYLEYTNQKYYDANISDANLILPPSSIATLYTSRVFGDVYINQTVFPTGTLPRPYVLNNSLNGYYSIKEFLQYTTQLTKEENVQTAIYPGYELQLYTPQQHIYGPIPPSFPFYYNAYTLRAQNYFNYTNYTFPSFVQLFNIYRFANYQNSLQLNFTGSPNLGYNRLILTYIDQFNNTIYMPLDVDFANLTTINLNVSSTVNALNPNETEISVNGTAYSIASAISPVQEPLPEGSPIYIYYDTNLNFYNKSVPYSSPSFSIIPYLDYCAFSPSAQGCSLADYLSQQEYSGIEANTIDFNTQYNSTDQCAPEPNSLLATGNFLQCNIYPQNKWNLPQYGLNGQAQPEYCVPVYQNGTGYLTSQLGLVSVVPVNSIGAFSYTFNVCGTGNDRVIAQYYGWPPPEPVVIPQVPLSLSATDFYGCKSNCQNYYEYNFSIAPATASQLVNIGLYELSFGNINTFIILAFSVSIAVYFALYPIFGKQKKREGNERPNRQY